MPAKSDRQRRFFGAELARKRAGEATRTHMSEDEMERMASKSNGSMPMRKGSHRVMKLKEMAH